jgi:hypothetical protein
MLDLAKQNPADAAEAGYEMTIVMPDGTDTDAKIKIRGVMSTVVKNYSRKVFQEMQMKEKMAKRRGKEPEEPTLEELEEMASKAAAVRIISWSNISEDGKEIKFSKEAAEDLMKRFSWIREQVLQASDDVTNFRLD